MLRRWRVVVIDDNPEGSLEAVLLSPLVVSQPLPSDASEAQLQAAISKNLLNRYLPLEEGELYANEADVDFQIRDFKTRRAECGARFPIVEVERDFARAWTLVGEFAKQSPDIVFLDVMFDQKTTSVDKVEAIINDLEESERIGQGGRPTVMDVLSRGGLFLLGKLLRSRGDVRQMPLIVLYSASREVQTDFRPFEYASDGRFEVVEKSTLRTSAERRRQVFRRRIRDYFLDGTVRPEDVRAAVALLGSRKAISNDHESLVKAFSRPIGSGWTFGSMFTAESVAYLSSEPSRRRYVVEDLEEFIAPLVGNARSLVDFLESSPARLLSHNNTRVTFAQRPYWADPEVGVPVSDDGAVMISLQDVLGDPAIPAALEDAVQRLPLTLREALGAAVMKMTMVPRKTEPGDVSGNAATRQVRVEKLDTFVKGLTSYDERWQAVLDQCRMHQPVKLISDLLTRVARFEGDDPASTATRMTLATASEDCTNLELLLSPSSLKVKEPLASLLQAIVHGFRHHACGDGDSHINVRFTAYEAPATLEIRLEDDGPGFSDLRYYRPQGRTGDLSTALVAAARWFDVEIHSDGIKRRPTARNGGEPEPSPVTRGTSFVLRVPAFRGREA